MFSKLSGIYLDQKLAKPDHIHASLKREYVKNKRQIKEKNQGRNQSFVIMYYLKLVSQFVEWANDECYSYAALPSNLRLSIVTLDCHMNKQHRGLYLQSFYPELEGTTMDIIFMLYVQKLQLLQLVYHIFPHKAFQHLNPRSEQFQLIRALHYTKPPKTYTKQQ